MNNRIPNELSIGDLVRPAKSRNKYRVERFSDDGKQVELHPIEPWRTSGALVRSTSQVIKNWRTTTT